MKRKLFLVTLTVAMLICLFTVSVGAVSTTGNIDYDEKVTLNDGTVLPIYDENKNPLIWYVSGTEDTTDLDGNTVTKNVYSSVVSTATNENPDANGYYVVYNGNTYTYTGPTGYSTKYHYSTSIYIKHVTDTSVNYLCDNCMVVGNFRGTSIGDIQGGTVDKIQYFFAPEGMTKSGDFRNSQLIVADYTQTTGLRSIINQSFQQRSTIQEVRLPTITPVFDDDGALTNPLEVNQYAFQNLNLLTTIVFPQTLYSISNNVFQNCTSLTSVTLGPNLTKIDHDAFYNCSKLSNISLKNTQLSFIGARAFYQVPIVSVVIPATLTEIKEQAFRYCKSLTSITFENGSQLKLIGQYAFQQDAFSEILLPDGLETIEQLAFSECANLESVILPDSVKSIGNYCFQKCSSITYIKLSSNLETLGAEAFRENSKLKFVDFNNCKITSVGKCMFYLCKELVGVCFPDSVTTIASDYIFDYCEKLGPVYLPANLENIGSFNSVPNVYFVNEKFNDPDNLPSKPEIYYMPSTLKTISSKGFHNSKQLNTTLVFPEGFTDATNPSAFERYGAQTRLNVVFLGDIKNFAYSSSTSHIYAVSTHFYFANENTHLADMTITGGNRIDESYAYFCADGVYGLLNSDYSSILTKDLHLVNPNLDSLKVADCINNERVVSYCFCGTECAASEVEGSALGHEFDTEKGASVHSIVYENYMDNGIFNIKCARCEECDGSEVNPIITDFKGYSINESANGITFGYTVDLEAIEEFESVNNTKFEFGFVVAVKSFVNGNAPLNNDGSVAEATKGQIIKANVANKICSVYDLKLVGTWDNAVDLDNDGTNETDVKDAEFYMSGYIYDGNKVCYIGDTETSSNPYVIVYNSLNS